MPITTTDFWNDLNKAITDIGTNPEPGDGDASGRVYEQATGDGYENAEAFLTYEIEQHRGKPQRRTVILPTTSNPVTPAR
jgi:hypothetical protein